MHSLGNGSCGLFRPRQIREISPRLEFCEAGTLIPSSEGKMAGTYGKVLKQHEEALVL